MNILIVDDSEIERKVMSRNISKLGLNPITVNNGEDCIAYLRSNKADLVLLDILMPGISGLGVLKWIRENFKAVELPVIMITSKDEDVVMALEAGANDYIQKPFNSGVAMARMKTQLDLAKYHHLSLKKNEREALNAMIVTYNHEINNPLSILCGKIDRYVKDEKIKEDLIGPVNRITSILQKIKDVTQSHEIEFSNYTDDVKMVELKKTS